MPGRPPKSAEQLEFEGRLGERVAAFRKQLYPDYKEGEGRKEFAERIGISATAYEKWEQRGAISAWGLARICACAQAKPSELLDLKANLLRNLPNHGTSSKMTKLIELFLSMNDSQRDQALELMEAILDGEDFAPSDANAI